MVRMRWALLFIFAVMMSGPALQGFDESSVKHGEPKREGRSWVEQAECGAPVREGARLLLRDRLESLGRQAPAVARRADADLAALAAGIGGEVRETRCGPYVLLEAVHPMPPTATYDTASALFAGVLLG